MIQFSLSIRSFFPPLSMREISHAKNYSWWHIDFGKRLYIYVKFMSHSASMVNTFIDHRGSPWIFRALVVIYETLHTYTHNMRNVSRYYEYVLFFFWRGRDLHKHLQWAWNVAWQGVSDLRETRGARQKQNLYLSEEVFCSFQSLLLADQEIPACLLQSFTHAHRNPL